MQYSRYADILREFEALLDYGIEVSNRLVGTLPTEKHHGYADSIYTKLLCHAISLQKLSPQTENKPEHEFWDLPSACAIARCIIETHDVLGYMVFSDVPSEERDFRVQVWQLHDQQRRSKMLESVNSTDPRAEAIHHRAMSLRAEVQNHPLFKRLRKNLQKKIEAGDAPSYLLTHQEINSANGVNHDYHTSATMWLSQYVHTFPMSLHQLNEFRAGTPEALQISSMPIQYSLGFLARSVRKMTEAFPHANIEVSDSDKRKLFRWCTVVEQGVTAPQWRAQ